ncbi:MAG TPA: peptide chain release factor N(5)-glutamine methyltransferase [Rhodocyclaceae bacterium]|nr:peptide chain release factor N(5)-glutamine methyltransferase [Rhodocyclaceae bacterium]
MSLPATLGEALQLARGRIDSVDAKLLLREASGCSASALIGFPERGLPIEAAQRFVDWLARREQGEPVAHLLGQREFFGRMFRVTPDTLIPRPDTELLVELALARLTQATPRVIDLGTGTGAIAISVALECLHANVTAVDASPAALAVAQDNAAKLAASVRFRHGCWFEPVAGERFDLIVSNPPYIAAGDVHLAQGDVRFEPRSALVAGSDGLDDIRHIVDAAPEHLQPGGSLLLEHGYDQADAVRSLLSARGFVDVQSWRDLAGIERVSGGSLANANRPY